MSRPLSLFVALGLPLFFGSACAPASDARDGGSADLSGVVHPADWADWKMPNPASTNLPNPARYDIGVPGIVVDLVTGLTWQRSVDPNLYTLEQARAYCAALAISGGGFRLPTLIELYSLVDFTREAPGPTVDATAFPDGPGEPFWSSTALASDPNFAWGVFFREGFTYYAGVTATDRVWCVK